MPHLVCCAFTASEIIGSNGFEDDETRCVTLTTQNLQENRKQIVFVKRAYRGYFGLKLGDQGKIWAPQYVCKTCRKRLRQWTTAKRKILEVGVPIV